jgi:hypothetical protein
MYRLYVRKFGNRDVSVSAIAGARPTQRTNRVENLVKILKSSGEPLPELYDVHIGVPGRTLYSLRQTDDFLNSYGQHQPIVIGDSRYDDYATAKGTKQFLRQSSRRIDEITPWYRRTGCMISPPYKPGAYGKVLHR